MALGMNVFVPAPMALPRPWATAATTYAVLTGPEYETEENGAQRWLNGVKFIPFGCDKIVGHTVDPCVLRETEALEGMGEEVLFEPFMAEVAVQCSTLATDGPELEAFLVAHAALGRSSILGAQVERSAYTTGNPSLASEAQIIANADKSAIGALIAVEDALADVLDGGQGMIHMTPGLFVALSAGGGMRFDADGRPYTATGHFVVADAGYQGVSPNTGDVAAGELWIYGSGPVFAKYSDVSRFTQDPETVDLERNLRTVSVQTYGLAFFEPCSVVAAEVDTSDSDVGGQ
jgi:hypothetical protein